MKKLFLATTALAALIAVPAGAADLRMPAKAAPAIAPACANFGGFYIGGHGGWTYYEHKFKDLDNFGFGIFGIDNFGEFTNTDNDWHAGVQAGLNWQTGCTLFGVQVDWSWTGVKTESFHTDFLDGSDGTAQLNSEMKWFGTARTRTGLVVENLLLYATGGFAFAGFDRNLAFGFAEGGPTAAFSSDSSRVGFVVGVGTEWAISANWSLNSEFLYMGFKKDEETFICPSEDVCADLTGAPFRYEFDDSVWVTRIGLNYRFGSFAPLGKGPLVAKY
jgi:outer membrane immunogenic protein